MLMGCRATRALIHWVAVRTLEAHRQCRIGREGEINR